ncbi:hypothetical protein HAX54_011331 [Datura stramonium]|uniref:Uncharacterized protein n=1 Tax=Datura stramonium TaxID=4076 RepID=A0ABS8TJA4_DATST|nr:hypothetical protein [Datura stramonium]
MGTLSNQALGQVIDDQQGNHSDEWLVSGDEQDSWVDHKGSSVGCGTAEVQQNESFNKREVVKSETQSGSESGPHVKTFRHGLELTLVIGYPECVPPTMNAAKKARKPHSALCWWWKFRGHFSSKIAPYSFVPTVLLILGAVLVVGYFYRGSGTSGSSALSRLEGEFTCTSELQLALPYLKKAYGDSMRKVLHVGPDTYAVDYLSPRYLNKTIPELARVSADGLVIVTGYPGHARAKVARLSKFGRPAKMRSASWWARFFVQTSLQENDAAIKKFGQAAVKDGVRSGV